MKILALEFSSPQRSVAAFASGNDGAPPRISEVVDSGSEPANPLAMAEAALRQGGFDRSEIECVAVGLGPGSYTGIRGAIALAQGWQLARAVRLLGIGSVECIVAGAREEGIVGTVTVIIDAQRQEFYLAGYEIDGAGWREESALRLATPAEAQARAQTGGALIGPEVSRWFPAGRVIFPRAARLAQLAAGRKKIFRAEELQPIYLREPAFVKAPPPRLIS